MPLGWLELPVVVRRVEDEVNCGDRGEVWRRERVATRWRVTVDAWFGSGAPSAGSFHGIWRKKCAA